MGQTSWSSSWKTMSGRGKIWGQKSEESGVIEGMGRLAMRPSVRRGASAGTSFPPQNAEVQGRGPPNVSPQFSTMG